MWLFVRAAFTLPFPLFWNPFCMPARSRLYLPSNKFLRSWKYSQKLILAPSSSCTCGSSYIGFTAGLLLHRLIISWLFCYLPSSTVDNRCTFFLGRVLGSSFALSGSALIEKYSFEGYFVYRWCYFLYLRGEERPWGFLGLASVLALPLWLICFSLRWVVSSKLYCTALPSSYRAWLSERVSVGMRHTSPVLQGSLLVRFLNVSGSLLMTEWGESAMKEMGCGLGLCAARNGNLEGFCSTSIFSEK